jgi:luciferase family oxidoreductase group 1
VTIPLSILDLAPIPPGTSATESFAASVTLAQLAERRGYRRVWYAEHHNMATIASSATSVLIAHIAAATTTIRVGAGGVMLPNHAPLTIAEQFGTLEALHPRRIDLGLGRAPGSDQATMRALRRNPSSADRFPEDVLELQGYLSGETRIEGVEATPGKGSNVPLYILGSSMFGAHLAAALGLPYAFASHFAPDALRPAVEAYRSEFRASAQAAEPYVIAGVNVVVASSGAAAREQFRQMLRHRAASRIAPGRALSDADLDAVLSSPVGQHIRQMATYAAVGTPDEVRDYLDNFAEHAQADELIVALQSPTGDERQTSAALLAEAMELSPAG